MSRRHRNHGMPEQLDQERAEEALANEETYSQNTEHASCCCPKVIELKFVLCNVGLKNVNAEYAISPCRYPIT